MTKPPWMEKLWWQTELRKSCSSRHWQPGPWGLIRSETSEKLIQTIDYSLVLALLCHPVLAYEIICNCKKDEVSKVASWIIKRSDRSLFKNGFFTFLYRNVDLYYVSQDRGRSIWVSTIARKKQIKTVSETLTWQIIKQNTYKTMRETLT